MKKLVLYFFVLFVVLLSNPLSAQDERDDYPLIEINDGIGIMHPDSIYLINFRFRMQNRAELFSMDANNLALSAVDARVRRLRLRFDGFLGSPKFAYYIQLSFSRGDQDFDDTGIPNIVRDAMFYYFVNPELYIGFGQGKLPGNRQRVISSGQQQFAERSIVNAYFNIDRDFGLFLYHNKELGNIAYSLKGAISTGDGRNQLTTNNGLAYTARFEFLPFGSFLSAGDYSEGDLERHPSPKLSIGLAYHYNSNAQRTRGQTGRELFENRNMESWLTDMMFKYQGWAVSAEYLIRNSNNPITMEANLPIMLLNDDFNYVFAGSGFNLQTSYLFRNNYELAVRYSTVDFDDEIKNFEPKQEMISLGGSKYLRMHRVKLQSNISYRVNNGNYALKAPNNQWSLMFQMELGI